jgi:hypothetical protein
MHAAVLTAVTPPSPTTHRIAFMPQFAATTAVIFVVIEGAARNGAVRVKDHRAGTRPHALEHTERDGETAATSHESGIMPGNFRSRLFIVAATATIAATAVASIP